MPTVSRWMSTKLVVIDANASIIEAIHLMKENMIRRLPVVSKGATWAVAAVMAISAAIPKYVAPLPMRLNREALKGLDKRG